jgi:SM-20-related protein
MSLPSSAVFPPHCFDLATQLHLTENLVSQGWAQSNDFLSQELGLALAVECRSLAASGGLLLAGVGRGNAPTLQPQQRGDHTRWLVAGQSLACDHYLALMEELRLMLNRVLFLGLEDYESHFALYAPGACYVRHLDRFRDDDRRTVSVVLYLNQAWLPEQGGALRLHLPDQSEQDISPLANRMVLFLSAEMPHEVLPATRDRLSLAGWFRRRA